MWACLVLIKICRWDAITLSYRPNTFVIQDIIWLFKSLKLLQINKLFLLRLVNEEQVLQRVQFHNTGPDALAG